MKSNIPSTMTTFLTLVEWSTVVVTFVMMASGLPGCVKMYREKNTSNAPYMLFLIFIVVSGLTLQYAALTYNATLKMINVVCLIVWSAYAAVYILVCSHKTNALFKLVAVAGLYTAHIYYLKTIPAKSVVPTLGNYLIVWCVIAYLIPIEDILRMVREKSNKTCDVAMLVGGTLSGLVWCLYGYLLNDVTLYGPSSVAVIVSVFKFVAFFAYMDPATHAKKNEAGSPRKGFKNGESSPAVQRESNKMKTRGGLRQRAQDRRN